MIIDLEQIKDIYILEIAKRLGIDFSKAIKTGDNYKIICPLPSHNETEPSFVLYSYTNSFYCFGCNSGGSNIDLVQRCLNLNDNDIKGVIEWLKEQSLIYDDTTQNKQSHKKIIPIIPRAKQELKVEPKKDFSLIYTSFINLLVDAPKDCYLTKDRCIDYNVLTRNNIKYISPNIDYKQELLKHYSESELLESGLLAISKKTNNVYFSFWDCDFIYPYYYKDKIYYMQGEFKDRAKKRKNLNRRVKPFLLAPKEFESYDKDLDINIVEGFIDVLSLLTLGNNAIAIIDANIRDEQLSKFNILKDYNIVLIGDYDITGLKAKIKIYSYMQENLFKVETKSIKDIASYFKINQDKKIKDINDILQIIYKEKRR